MMAGLVPSGAPLESLFSSLPASGDCLGIPGLTAASLQPQLLLSHLLFLILTLLPPLDKDSCDHTGATQIIKNNLSISRP